MPTILELWQASPEQLSSKHVHQIIAFTAEGELRDGNRASTEFREFLRNIPPAYLSRYVDDCLTSGFANSGLALQDVINEVGRRLGFLVTNGRYRGVASTVLGYDGLWRGSEGGEIVVEVKTTDTYRIDLERIAGYRKELIEQGEIKEKESSILIIVGRQDTGDLEAQIRGSRHAWDIRVISAEALLRLMDIRVEIEDPGTAARIRMILRPYEYTRLDGIIDLVFSTKEEILQEELGDQEQELDQASAASGKKVYAGQFSRGMYSQNREEPRAKPRQAISCIL